MKSYREIADSVLARREQYIAAQRKKKQLVARAAVSVGSVALVSLAGFALWGNDAFHDAPPVTDGGVTTTTAPTGAETTTATTAPSTATDGGVTTTVTDAPTQTATTTVTTRPSTSHTVTTEPSKTTATTTAPKKVLITGDEPDDVLYDNASLSKKRKYLSRSLEKAMALYEGVDVEYAVIVAIPPMREDWSDDFWESTEELSQFHKEYYDVYNAFFEEAKSLNPSWSGVNENEIKVWTDTMRANYDYWLTLIDRWDKLEKQYKSPYVESVLNQRYETLKAFCNVAPIDVLCFNAVGLDIEFHGYYVEFTADEINALAERGGYTFHLASGEDRDVLIDQ